MNPILRDLDLKTDWNEPAHQCFLKPERYTENHSLNTHTPGFMYVFWSTQYKDIYSNAPSH